MEGSLPSPSAGERSRSALQGNRAGQVQAWLAGAVYNGSRGVAVALVAALLFSINHEVFARYLFNSPTVWVTEYSTYFVVAITFVGAAFAVSRDSHIRVTLWLDHLPADRRRRAELAGAWLALLAVVLIAWKAAEFVHGEYLAGTRDFGLLATPMWVPQSAVAVGYFTLLLALALEACRLAGTTAPARRWAGGAAIALCTAALFAHSFGTLPGGLSAHQGVWLAVAALCVASAAWCGLADTARLLAFAALPVGGYYLSAQAPLGWQAAVLVGTMLYLLFAGVRVAFVLSLLGVLGILFWMPSPSLRVLAERSWSAVHTFELSAIPMFVLMGALLVKSDASGEMFGAMRALFGRVRGAFAFASIGAAGVFAAVSGSSLATAATLGRVAGPEMVDQGYDNRLAYGVLAAGGTLGIMIPPSIAMIVYGSLAGVPVTNLFMAGVLPGLLLMALFAVVVCAWIVLRPQDAPAARSYTLTEKWRSLRGVVPFLLLMAAVLGTLYLGIATPTEAGAVGAVAALVLCALRGKLGRRMLVEALEETALVTSFLLLIAVGASQMSYVMDYLSMPAQLVDYIKGLQLSSGVLLVCIVLAYLVLGMFIEPISMVLMTLPVMMPLVHAVGWDPLWFGIVLVLLVELGLITAPVGMILFVLEGVAEGRARLKDISIGAAPFVLVMLFAVAVFYWFPAVVTWLPGVMSSA
ncbi:TRAP transporter large permease subunit [Schlegelella sp. S2-27]|uniref:TRAP transporter large permease subunit n=1 Tax=Caldimonas mangrovi TaxID=2944811 RepID=A0ABT0YVF0_9BURK|nr:TRAP transporter large permease subunit [Caldimonas mangrovi]MCM5682734.1 TRAP transporter large permease subunit [Caldimonas mangrovi]